MAKKSTKRAVSKGLKIDMICCNKAHSVYYTPKGHLVLANHSDLDLDVDMALNVLGGDEDGMCRCAIMMKAWRSGVGLHSADIPRPISGVCSKLDVYKKIGERFCRRWLKKVKFQHRKTIRCWPNTTSIKDVYRFLQEEFARYGMLGPVSSELCENDDTTGKSIEWYARLSFASLPYGGVEYDKVTTTRRDTSVIFDHRLLPQIAHPLGLSSSRILVVAKIDKKGRLFIKSAAPGASAHRIIDKTNIDTVLFLILLELWRKASGSVLANGGTKHYNNIYSERQAQQASVEALVSSNKNNAIDDQLGILPIITSHLANNRYCYFSIYFNQIYSKLFSREMTMLIKRMIVRGKARLEQINQKAKSDTFHLFWGSK